MRWRVAAAIGAALLCCATAASAEDLRGGGSAHVQRIAALWNRPSTDGQVIDLLSAGAQVVLLDRTANRQDQWWYVDSPAGRGWLRAGDLRFDSARTVARFVPVATRPAGAFCGRAKATQTLLLYRVK